MKVRVIVATTQMNLITNLKSFIGTLNHNIEMIINVNKASEAENKINRLLYNALIIDLDTVQPEEARVRSFQSRFKLLVIYTSFSLARANLIKKDASTDFIIKPSVLSPQTGNQFAATVSRRIEGFFKQQILPGTRDLNKTITGSGGLRERKLIAIASSTGGTNALEEILMRLPADVPPIVLVQHMPSGFTKLFAERLNSKYKQEVLEAQTGDYLQQGRLLMAPADRHMKLIRQQSRLAVECFIGKKIHGVMPAADVLFESVAELVRQNAVGVVLTGMGADGAKGLLQMRNAGADNIGQNEATCVVYGMPKVAKELGAIKYELPLDQIAAKIMDLV
jgi:two-component system chemotaxis response regulator CheB